MLTYAIKRLIGAIPTIFIIITLAFFMMRVAPGGPFNLERPLPDQIQENLNRIYHLDRTLVEQYFLFLQQLLQGNLGPSFVRRDFSVIELLQVGLPISLMIGGLAMTMAVTIGSTLGALAALRQNSRIDYSVMALAMVGITIPNFVVAPTLSLLFGVYMQVLPTAWPTGEMPWRLILPVVALALPQIAVVARLTRGSMIEVLRSNHIRTARAKGLPEHQVLISHALKPALLPVVSYLGPALAYILTGSVVIEKIFSIPGIGRYFVEGALNRDYTLVMGTVVVFATFIVLFNLVVDLVYGWLDPKVRYN